MSPQFEATPAFPERGPSGHIGDLSQVASTLPISPRPFGGAVTTLPNLLQQGLQSSPETKTTSRVGALVQATQDFRAVISVGRTLSSPNVSGVVNKTLSVTYTVYNLRSDTVSGLLLTTTLQSGVTYQSATPAPDRNGQQLAFSLGSLPPLGSAGVQLTVTLSGTSITQIDSGAVAYGYWSGYPVQSQAVAAALRTGSVNTGLLGSSSSIDANPSDPYISGQAAELGNDPNRIFQFVRDQIGYESYQGALRGARGTLWSMAGNSLDKASLLVALLRASGIPAQYVSGTLPLNLQQQLILSMFPAQDQLTGYVASGATLSDPANDPTLQSEATSHYWVQLDNGTGTLVDADPDFAGAQIGQTFTQPKSTFSEVADSLHHHVTVKLNAEIYEQSLLGPPTVTTNTQLQHTFTSAELVGHPLSLGHLVNTRTAGFIFTATTNTYSPYLQIGQNGPEPSADPIIRGTDYQEVLTNVPLGSQVLTGIFFEFDTTDPSGNTTVFTHAILDRIGYAARKGLVPANFALTAGGQPAVTPFDNVTASVESGLTSPAIPPTLAARDNQIQARASGLPQIAQDQTAPPGDAQEVAKYAIERSLSISQTILATFAASSQLANVVTSSTADSRTYFDSPRVVVASSMASQTGSITLGIDLLKDDIRAIALPEQNVLSVNAYRGARGSLEGIVEQQTLAALQPPPGAGSLNRTVSVVDVFSAAAGQGIPTRAFGASNLGQLDTTDFSADAKARISDSIQSGTVILVPARNVTLNGVDTIAWYEFNPTTGVVVDTNESGGHQALTEFTAAYTATFAAGFTVDKTIEQYLANLPGVGKSADVECQLAAFGTLLDLLPLALPQNATLLLALYAGEALALTAALGVLFALVTLLTVALTGLAITCTKSDALSAVGGSALVERRSLPAPSLIASTRSSQPSSQDHPDIPLIGLAAAATLSNSSTSQAVVANSSTTNGIVVGKTQTTSLRATEQITASWSSTSISNLQISALIASNAGVEISNGQSVGTGSVELTATSPIRASVSGNTTFSVNGTGDLSFYGPATGALGVSGNWSGYTATLKGSSVLSLTTNGLTLNGTQLPLGTYTVTASQMTLGGLGQTISPNFAASATFAVTSGTVYLGPGSGTFTSAGANISPAQGITLDGFTGSLSVTGNGTLDAVNLNGTATNVLAVAGNPATLTTNQNTPVTFASLLTTSLADTYNITAEAPPGWTVTMDPSGNVTATPAPGLQAGTFPIFLTAVSQTDPALVAQAAVTVTLSGTTPGVTLNIAPDPTFTVPVGSAQLPSAYRATIQNLGPAADTFNLTFPVQPPGFNILTSESTVTIPPGGTAIIGIYLSPLGALPPPGTLATFTVAVASTTNSAVNATGSATLTVPSIQALALVASPASLSVIPGSPLNSVLTISSVGNVPVTLSLTATPPSGVTLSGLSNSLTLNQGESTTQALTLSADSTAPLTTPLTTNITATFGSANNQQTSTASVAVVVNAAQSQSAANASTSAATLGRTDIASTLSGLSSAINSVISSCSPTSQQLVLNYIDNLTAEMNAPYLANFVSSLGSARAAIASSNCANITTALNTLSTVLSNLNTVLSSPAAYPFDFQLLPNSATAQPNQTATFGVFLRNTGTVANTYSLSLGSLPAGVTGNLTQTSVTLNPSQSTTGLNLTITPSTGEAVPFNLTASVNGVSNSARTIQGTLTARNQFLQVQDVTPKPGFTNASGSVDVVAHIANVVNQSQAVQVKLAVLNSQGTIVATGNTQNTTLSVQNLITTVDFGMISTQGLANGNYTLRVTVTDSAGNPLPGGTGTGTLLVGSPVTANLSVTPQTLPPGNGTVTTTLAVSPTTSASGLTLLGSVSGTGGSSMAFNGNDAYLCGGGGIGIVDVSNPASPSLLSTFGVGDASSIGGFLCQTFSNGSGTALGFAGNSGLVTYDLTNPTAPVKLGGSGSLNIVTYPYLDDLLITSGNAYFTTHALNFNINGSIFTQNGEFFDYKLTNPASPAPGSVLTGSSDAAANSGPHFGIAQADATTLYFGSTTASGANAQNGQAKLSIVDISNPASLQTVGEVLIPQGAWLTDISIVGNIAVVAGRTLGWTNTPTCCPYPDFYSAGGNLFFATLDITNHRSPTLLNAIDTGISTTFIPARTLVSMSGNLLAMAVQPGDQQTTQPQIVLLDITDPKHLVVTPAASVPGLQSLAFANNYLYAATSTGLNIYTVTNGAAIDYTASVRLPSSGKIAYNPASFSVMPVITPGTNFDTATWANPGTNTITWTSAVTGIQPADVLPVVLGGNVNFTVALGSGTIPLPPLNINSGQILGLTPATQTATPGQPVAYTVTLNNPTSSAVTYNLAVIGVSSSWVTLPATASVPAGSSSTVTLNLQSAIADIAGTYGFTITASNNGVSGSVAGTLVLQGNGTIGAQSSVVVALTPSQVTAGPGTTANFVVQLTNAGASTDTYNLTAGLPTGVTAAFDNASVQVPPGVNNFVQTGVHLNVAPGTALGSPSFTVTATSSNTPSVAGQASGALNIIANGLTLTLTPNSTPPLGTLPLTVTNTGTVADTFNLSLAGPAALAATLSAPSVHLSPGSSQTVNVAIGNPSFATLGSLPFQVIGTSATNPAITALVNGSVTIPASLGVTASFQPASQSAAASGSTTFPLVVQNTGTIEDGYSAVITATTGKVQATLTGLDGNPTQSIAQFRLPGVTTGQLFLNLTLTGSGNGTATVTITSLTNPAITSVATATITPNSVQPPTANAGPSANIPLHHNVVLDGSGSSDPNSPALPLTYTWTVTSVPDGSSVTNNSIHSFASYPRASFTPDVAGNYTFILSVSNGQKSASASVTLVASYMPPVAIAGKAQNAQTRSWVLLNGKNSYDPEGAPITFAWSVDSVPQGSLITTASLHNNATPKPFFQPDADGVYKLHLIVADSVASSAPDYIVITTTSVNVPPNANAGYAQSAEAGHAVTLNGSLSNDPDNGPSPLTFAWTVTQVPASSSVSTSSLTGSTTATPSFVPDVAGIYQVTLTVSDGAATSSDSVIVTAYPGFSPPNAVTIEQVDTLPTTAVVLDGKGSFDPDNAPATLTYAWSLVSAPPLSSAAISSGTSSTLQFTPDLPGYYVLRLEVSDGIDTSDRNILLLAANPCDADGNGIVNQIDLDLIQSTLGSPALPSDPRDPNHIGTITVADYNTCKADLTQYQLTINIAGTGTGTVQPPTGLEPANSPITLNATPGQCSVFAGFSPNVVNNAIVLSGPTTVTATFNDDTAQQVGILPVGGTASGQVIVQPGLNRRVTNTNNWLRSYTLTNTGAALTNVYLALDPPLSNVTALVSGTGTTFCAAPGGSWYIAVPDLAAGATQSVTIQVTTQNPVTAWSAGVRILAGGKP